MASKNQLDPMDYELPKLPKSVMDSWMPRLQAVAIVTVFLAGTEAQLISNLPDPKAYPEAAGTALRFFAYSGLLLNLGATLSAILLLIAVASLPTTARQIYMSCSHGYPRKIFDAASGQSRRSSDLNSRLLDGHGETYVLHAFGIARGWTILLKHCILSFATGCLCTFLHIIINLWLRESKTVAAVVLAVGLFGFLPPFVVFMFHLQSAECHQCAEERKYAGREKV